MIEKPKCPRCRHWAHDEALDPRCTQCRCVNIDRTIERMMEAETELANVGNSEGLWHTGQHEDCATCETWRKNQR